MVKQCEKDKYEYDDLEKKGMHIYCFLLPETVHIEQIKFTFRDLKTQFTKFFEQRVQILELKGLGHIVTRKLGKHPPSFLSGFLVVIFWTEQHFFWYGYWYKIVLLSKNAKISN